MVQLGWLEGGRDEEDVESESQDGVAGDNLNRVKGQALVSSHVTPCDE